jgi:hypothetical protein
MVGKLPGITGKTKSLYDWTIERAVNAVAVATVSSKESCKAAAF